jgi:hypothetical protein
MSNTNHHTANTPRTLGADGNPLVPGSFRFRSISIIRGDIVEDISDIVTSVDIVQDLYSPTIVATAVVRDTRSFYENSKVKLSGFEMILIDIEEILHSREITAGASTNLLTLRFVVSQYSDFEVDSGSIYTKQFTIEAISNYSYLSRLNKISKSFKNDPIENIGDIFQTHLLYDKNKYFDYNRSANKCTTLFSSVITYRTPLQAIKWLQSKAFDENKTPFFVYSRLRDGNIVARSWSFLSDPTKNQIYRTYIKKQHGTFEPGTYESYLYEKDKILEITSNSQNNELQKTISGKYDILLKTIDYSDLTYTENNIDISNDRLSKEERKDYDEISKYRKELVETLGVNKSESDKFLQERLRPAEITYHKPYPLFSDGTKSSRDIDFEHFAPSNYYRSKLNFEKYEAVVYGDFNLNPGILINLQVPVEDNQNSELSGLYVIGVVVHSFRNGKYVNRLNLLKI